VLEKKLLEGMFPLDMLAFGSHMMLVKHGKE